LQERKISWLELFYDLVYVAAIAQLTGYLAEHPTWKDLGYFFFIFCLIFWSWLNGSYYHDTHGSTGIRTRYFTLLQMFVVAAVTITMHDLFNGAHQTFAVAFACVQAIITYLWWSVGYYDPSHRRLNFYYTVFYSASLGLFIVSAFTDLNTAYVLWSVALVFNYIVPFIAAPTTVKELRRRGIEYVTTSSIIERFGLFTIIVLGENILGIIHGISHVHDRSVTVWVIFLLAVLIAFLLWWVYFDMTGDSEAKTGYHIFLMLNFINIPLLASFAIAGSAIRVILSESETEMHSPAAWMFGIAISVILCGIFAFTSLMQQDEDEAPVMKKLSLMVLATAGAVLLLTCFSGMLSALVYLALVALILALPVYIGTRIWVKFKIFSEGQNDEEPIVN